MGIGRDILYAAGLTITAPIWGIGLLRTGKWRSDWPGRMGRVPGALQRREGAAAAGERVLIHAVSVGEVNLIRGLVAELADAGVEVFIAATTNTGFERAMKLYGGTHRVVRYPLDFSFAVARFLDAIRPDVVALVELEVWPNFMDACNRRGIPVCVVNGRLSARSFKRYRLARPVVRGMFSQLSAAAVQTQAYAERFREMGVAADRIHVLDTMKWDTAQIADEVAGSGDLARELGIDCARPVVVLGSTGDDEEKPLVGAMPADAQVVMVPRKPERFDAVAGAFPGIVRRTRSQGVTGTEAPEPKRLFLLDTLGELRKAYALADVVVVGRSFNGWGGSDPIEPVGLGKPTIIGPDHSNFADAVSALEEGGGVIVARDAAEAGRHVARLLGDRAVAARLADAGRAVILSRQGATRRHAALLLNLLRSRRR